MKLQLHAAHERIAEEQRKTKHAEAEVVAMQERVNALHAALDQNETTRKEQDDILRLQRGFTELRLLHVAKKHMAQATQEQQVVEHLGQKLREQTKAYEGLLSQQQETFQKQVADRDRVVREKLGTELRRDVEKKLGALMKKKEAAIEGQIRQDVTEEVEDGCKKLIDALKKERDAANRRAEMYKTRL